MWMNYTEATDLAEAIFGNIEREGVAEIEELVRLFTGELDVSEYIGSGTEAQTPEEDQD